MHGQAELLCVSLGGNQRKKVRARGTDLAAPLNLVFGKLTLWCLSTPSEQEYRRMIPILLLLSLFAFRSCECACNHRLWVQHPTGSLFRELLALDPSSWFGTPARQRFKQFSAWTACPFGMTPCALFPLGPRCAPRKSQAARPTRPRPSSRRPEGSVTHGCGWDICASGSIVLFLENQLETPGKRASLQLFFQLFFHCRHKLAN